MKIYFKKTNICQMYIDTTLPVDFEVVEELSQTDRGSNGYGSTGR